MRCDKVSCKTYCASDIASIIGIIAAGVYLVIKRILKVRYITGSWIPNLCLQAKRARLETAIRLTKMIQYYHRKQFADIITVDET